MAKLAQQPITHRGILALSIPIMLSNVTQPLIGVVNTGVIGQMGSPALMGGVALGALIFSFLFWGFGFLRLSTSGLAAQATGANQPGEVAAIIWRSLAMAFLLGCLLLCLSPVLGPLSIALMGGSAEVKQAAATYFSYRIFAAPAALANFAILGWFVGQGKASTAFMAQLALNVSNMLLSAVLVLKAHMGMAGVGLAVLVAEYAAAAFGLVLVLRRQSALGHLPSWQAVFDAAKFKSLITANADMMVRTVCLLFAFAWFTSRGARGGDVVVAANAILLHLFELAAYMIDGFAYAAEALVGQAIGARNRAGFSRALWLSSIWAMGFGALSSLIIFVSGPGFIARMTVNADVQSFAADYLGWAALTPFLGAACFLYDGIFTGAMATRDMRNMMVLSLLIYLGAWWLLEPRFANHGLWAALCLFFVARSITFATRLPAIRNAAFGSRSLEARNG